MAESFKNTPEQARKLWVEALRSGKYRQGTRRLKQEDGLGNDFWCCLGVACDLFFLHERPLMIERRDDLTFRFDEQATSLPREVADWLGVRDVSGCYGETALVHDNDCHLKSFPEIASIIESAPKGLFVEATDAT